MQGVGFRPFVYRLARSLGLKGWVSNSPQGVIVEAEGSAADLQRFLLRLDAEKPPHSAIQSLETAWLDPAGFEDFVIRPSAVAGAPTALILPDIATCAECRREIFDPSNRRFRYPFTNCTHCGPRFSIIRSLPYDRAGTSMAGFVMCPRCQAEYDDPGDRRFHAQPNACPECGPRLELWDAAGAVLAAADEALRRTVQALRAGQVVAVKGLGGFHLMAAAGDDAAVRRLRDRKHREEKPLALMFPSLEEARRHCQADDLESRLLLSPESPIVLLRRLRVPSPPASRLSDLVAPANPYLGAMLPYTPLHHLLMSELAAPVVATSGNLSDEPICTDEHEALSRLGGLADLFLAHNRPIVRHVDDSIVRVMLGRELVMRRARGYAPLPVPIESPGPETAPAPVVLAVGAHLKNTAALAVGEQVFLSQHIGDLENEPALRAFQRAVADLQQLHAAPAQRVAADLHPDYLSTRHARESGLPLLGVQHHYAHVLACMAENRLRPPVLGVSWDGTGLGEDGTVWGGEFLKVTADGFERVGHLRVFRLPGGDKAVKEPRRSALGALFGLFGEGVFEMDSLAPVKAFTAEERAALRVVLRQGINAPLTSSMGRLFDALASVAGLRQILRFEGQAAMDLEFALEGMDTAEAYPMPVADDARRDETAGGRRPRILDWGPLLRSALADAGAGVSIGLISARFHNALVEAIVALATLAGEPRVALTGGCFQNRYLAEQAVRRLRAAGFAPYWHQRVPPNDGGVALGQALAARLARST